MIRSVVFAFVALLACAGCSSEEARREARQRELTEFARSHATQAKVAKAVERSIGNRDRNALATRSLFEVNGRWRTGAIDADRHLELSFGMDGVVVVDLMSPRGSVASSQGKFAFLPTGPASVTLASPRPALKPYASFMISKDGNKPVMVLDRRNIRIYRM